jgi:uncharacterized protein YbbK (DUF523 family)/uncharacterized protein YbgA (DUF1722 family)
MSGSQAEQTPALGISSCLLGEDVRYDGGNKGNAYVIEILSQHLRFISICPETAVGMGVPRPPIQLISREQGVRAVGVHLPELDVTADLVNFGEQKGYVASTLCGYIFKSRSPSCGLRDTPVLTEEGTSEGPGIYARQILAANPYLPVIDETSLADPEARDNFLERVFALARWRRLANGPPSLEHLRAFHSMHELQLSIHHANIYNKLSRFLNLLREPLPGDAESVYIDSFMSALETSNPENSRSSILSGALARLDGLISRTEYQELEVVATAGQVSWSDLVFHIKSLAQKYGLESLSNQSCMNPSTGETALRFSQVQSRQPAQPFNRIPCRP